MNKKWMATGILGTVLMTGVAGYTYESAQPIEAKQNTKQAKVKNVIFMIPDGYSAAYATNYRWYQGGEETELDGHLKGMMRTYSANTKVTDSAAAGTAMATGTKTNNGTIGMDPSGKEVASILDRADQAGKATGLVSTSAITHATPAVFASHVATRANEADIAKQYMDEMKVDVLLGGGQKFFFDQKNGGVQEAGNLVKKAERAGYQYADSLESLNETDGRKVLGLFAEEGMAPELDRENTNQPSLATMTSKALQTLKKDRDGFFLMVEGSQIDWAGHAHDAAWAMKDAEAFHQAVEKVLRFAAKDKHTLVVVAGDHDTGGMSVGGYDEYVAKPEVLKNVKATGDEMVRQFNDDLSNIASVVKRETTFDLTAEEIQTLQKVDAKKRVMTLNEMISKRAYVGWTTAVHTGVDVPLYAYGPQSEQFSGLHENTDIPGLMANAMKLKK